jgi:hypothetical protein
MPWRGARRPGEYPTLGIQVAQWIQNYCVIPDGMHQREPYLLTDEMLVYLKRFYRLHPGAVLDERRPSSAFYYRGAQLMRPQKWGKSPFGGAIDLCEGLGPVRFDGWDADGEPVGRPQPTPWIQIVATSEAQTDNTWLAIVAMASQGPIADLPGIDIGVLDINLPSGGKIEPETSSGRARLGARLTYAHFDESHLMTTSNGGVNLAENMKRNIAGMGGRWGETTNAFDPSESSVAQRTQESRAIDVLIDYNGERDAKGRELRRPDLADDQACLEYLRYVYGDSWWVDLDRVLADARDPAVCSSPATAMRFFFNRIEVGITDAVDSARWDAAARDGELERGAVITLGFDGSRSRDFTALVASRVTDGRWFPLRIWNPADYADGLVPRTEVDQVLAAAFEAYDVRFLFGDPYRWQEYFAIWAARWPERVVEFPTNVEKRMDDAIARFNAAFGSTFTHNGDPILGLHAKSAALTKGRRRAPRPDEPPSTQPYYLKVVPKRQGLFIDALVAGILAEVARGEAIEKGALAPPAEPMVEWA